MTFAGAILVANRRVTQLTPFPLISSNYCRTRTMRFSFHARLFPCAQCTAPFKVLDGWRRMSLEIGTGGQ